MQPAIGTKAEVELVTVQRIQDPATQARDVVNVQMRVRRTAPQTETINYGEGLLYPTETTARNPQTSEVYQPVDKVKRGTPSVAVSQLAAGSSADAYVWLRVPENVTTIDLLIPKTQSFKNVPIAN